MLKIRDDETFLAALMDHENKILNQVGEWVNRRVEVVDGHTTLLAEPRFFKSNPNAMIIEGMLKEGAKMGVSIGAIVKNKEHRDIMGKSRTVFTDLELVEASFVAIPSNRHAHALAVAKSYQKNMEVKKMAEEEVNVVPEPVEVAEPVAEVVEEEKSMVDSDVEVLNKELTMIKEAVEAASKEYSVSLEKVTSELEATKKELEELKAMPLNKAISEPQIEELSEAQIKQSEIDAIKSGKVPLIRKV